MFDTSRWELAKVIKEMLNLLYVLGAKTFHIEIVQITTGCPTEIATSPIKIVTTTKNDENRSLLYRVRNKTSH